MFKVSADKQSGYKLSSNGFRAGDGEPVSVLLSSANFPASHASKNQQHIQTSGPYRTPSQTIAVENSASKTIHFGCRSPEAQPKPLTPPVTPIAGTPPPTSENSFKKEKVAKSFSIADLLAPDNKPRFIREAKPTLQLHTSPRSEGQVHGSHSASERTQQRNPVALRRPDNLHLRSSELFYNSSSTNTAVKPSRLSDFRAERPELEMQFEQTNRNINYLKSFLLAQRLNSL